MSDSACYELDERGERFVPTALAGSPWAEGFQHGGPVCGLLARAFEEQFGSKGLLPVRLSVDLFRSVPMQPRYTAAGSIPASKRASSRRRPSWRD